MAKTSSVPTKRRQYYLISSPVSGLDVSMQEHEIAETASPNCHEVSFKKGVMFRSVGWSVFGDSDVATSIRCGITIPLRRSRELVGRVDVGALHWDLLAKVVVKFVIGNNLVVRVTPINIPQTKNLVSRVTSLSVESKSLVMRASVYKKGTYSGVCSVTVTH